MNIEGAIKVTVTDPDTDEVLDEQIVENDYVLITAGNRYHHSTASYANGTAVITVKRDGS